MFHRFYWSVPRRGEKNIWILTPIWPNDWTSVCRMFLQSFQQLQIAIFRSPNGNGSVAGNRRQDRRIWRIPIDVDDHIRPDPSRQQKQLSFNESQKPERSRTWNVTKGLIFWKLKLLCFQRVNLIKRRLIKFSPGLKFGYWDRVKTLGVPEGKTLGIKEHTLKEQLD